MSLEQKMRLFKLNLEQIEARIRQIQTAINIALQKPNLDGVIVEWEPTNKQKFKVFIRAKQGELDKLLTELLALEL